MGRSLGYEYEDSLETYNIIAQMKKLKPTELKNLFEAMVNSLTIPTKEGLVFLVWEGLEPHERDLFNFPSNDIYSESIKDSYLEIFQHNQPLSSIWNNNDITRRRNRIRNRNIYSGDDSFEAYTRRRLDFNSIIDQLFDTTVGINITPGRWGSISSSESESSTSTSSSSSSSSNNNSHNPSNNNSNNNSNNSSNNTSDNENENNGSGHTIFNALRRARTYRNPPALTRRQLMRRHERMSSPSVSIPTSISNGTYPYFQRIRTPPTARRPTSSNNSNITNTRFISTERRTMTVNNNDISTFHVISRNRNERQDSSNSSNSNSSNRRDNNNLGYVFTNRENSNISSGNNNNNDSNSNNNNEESSSNMNTINLSASSVNESANNYIYTTSNEPRNIIRVSSGINLNIFNENNNSNSNSNSNNIDSTSNTTSSISNKDRTTTASS